MTVLDLAEKIKGILDTSGNVKLTFKDLPSDDPKQRQPVITSAKKLLKWEPVVTLDDGLAKAIEYFKGALKKEEAKKANTKEQHKHKH